MLDALGLKKMREIYSMLTFPVYFPDLISGIRREKFNKAERDEILSFLDRAFVRLDAWFQWFNTSQIGNKNNCLLSLFNCKVFLVSSTYIRAILLLCFSVI